MKNSQTVSTGNRNRESILKIASNFKSKPSPKIIVGSEKNWIHFRLKVSLLKIIASNYSNPLDWIKALSYLVKQRRKFLGDYRIKKMVQIDGKYYMGLYTPGWNDENYHRFIASELQNFKENKTRPYRFNQVFLAITKKCALQCEHCYEWDSLNKKDVLSAEELNKIISKIQEKGSCQIQLTGGEPLLKMNVLLDILENAKKETNFWIDTSGFKMTHGNAKVLKEKGLTGVFISLDHFNPEEHNHFRKFKDAYHWVQEGVKNAIANNLVVALSVCVRNEFITEDNLLAYMENAKNMGVHFVQFLEPKPVGHYSNKDVLLKEDKINILESFFLKMNFAKRYNSFPIICYHGYYQRRQGCFSAGKRGIYIDTNGEMNACPFCHTKNGSVLSKSFEQNLDNMLVSGCKAY
jgi:MoaA/NifB/PqqE/SkfB family radical SAM enzyme